VLVLVEEMKKEQEQLYAEHKDKVYKKQKGRKYKLKTAIEQRLT
jgi:hypothetical protein